MKKFFYIFCSAFALLTACSKEFQTPVELGELLPEGTMVKTTFTVSYPTDIIISAETRSLEEKPDIENLYVAIFGSTELQYWIPATLKEKPGAGEYTAETKYTYEVELPVSSSPLQIHFIGNVPEKFTPSHEGGAVIPDFGGSTEESIMNQMISQNKKGGYWQKIKVDYIKATKNGNVVALDFGAGISLSNVPLVRNYAKLNYMLTDKEGAHLEFDLLGYTLINVPSMAYIAPWQSGLRYDNHYREIASGDANFFETLVEEGYSGYTPAGSIITTRTIAAQPERLNGDNPVLDPVYMYERPIPDGNNQTAVIAKIHWKPRWNTSTMGDPSTPNAGYDPKDYILPKDDDNNDNPNYTNGVAGNTYYYKIELTDRNDQYFPILRNLYYTIKLESIKGPGSASYKEALEGPYFGNVSTSMEAANMNEISDSQTRLWVDKIDHINLSEMTREINFKYYPDASNLNSYITDAYQTIPDQEPNSYVYVEVLPVKTAQGAEYPSAIATKTVNAQTVDDITISNGKITVKCKAPSNDQSVIYRSKIRLTGVTKNKRKLYREVTITVMPVQTLTSDTEVIAGTNNKYTVRIGLPPELSYSIFPLTFKIEAQNNNLATNDTKLPVSFGPSAWTSGKNSYYFIKTITWAEYCSIVDGNYVYTDYLDCSLFSTDNQTVKVKITNFATEENGTTTDNKYFNGWTQP